MAFNVLNAFGLRKKKDAMSSFNNGFTTPQNTNGAVQQYNAPIGPQQQTQQAQATQVAPKLPVKQNVDAAGNRIITIGDKTYPAITREQAELLGATPSGIKDPAITEIAAALAANRPGGVGTSAFNFDFLQQANDQQKQAIMDVAAKLGIMPPEQPLGPNGNVEGALGTASIGIGAGVATGIGAEMLGAVGVGATVGLAGGPAAPITVPLLATAAAVSVIISKVTLAKRQTVKEAYGATFMSSKANMALIIDAVNKGYMTPDQAVEAWNYNLAQIRTAKAILKRETDSNIDKFLSGGGDELIKIEQWEASYGIHEAALLTAMQNPNAAMAAYQMPADAVDPGWFGNG